MIFIYVGTALLMSVGKWYEPIISLTVATTLVIIAYFLDVKLQISTRKSKIILFTICCVFAVTGLIFLLFGVIFVTKGLLVASLVCLCGEMFIVIICTIYYVESYRVPLQFSTLYSVFLLMYEYIVVVFGLQISLNSVIDCVWNRNTTIRNDENILFH